MDVTTLIKKMEGYYPLLEAKPKKGIFKTPGIFESAKAYLLEKISIDSVIRELTCASVALGIYLFMQSPGRLKALLGFVAFIGLTLIFATVYNLFKASFKSLTPGLICLVGGLVLLNTKMHLPYYKWVTTEYLNYIVGLGAFFMALSLLQSEEKY